MRKMVTRTVALFILIVMFASCMGCGNTSKGTNAPTPTQGSTTTPEPTKPKEPVTIVSLHEEGTVPAENCEVIKAVRERTGINWSPLLVAPGETAAKLNALIAAKNTPDIIPFTLADGKKFAENNVIIKLDSLLAQYGKDILANRKDYLGQGLNTKDTTYGIPRAPGYPTALAIRTDWLANVGMQMPKNLDSFYEVLKAFTNNDPNKNGKKDTMGMAACIAYNNMFEAIFAAYGVPINVPIALADGKITTYMKHPNYLKAVEYLRKLYQEGLMEPDFATIPNMSCLEKLWNGTYGSIGFTPVGTTNNWLGRYKETPKPTFDFTVLAGPESTGGFVRPRGSLYYGISSSCKNPQEAMKLANFLGSPEGDELLYFGVENKMYKWVDKAAGKYEYIPPYNDSATQRTAGGFIFWPVFSRIGDNAEVRTLNPLTRSGLELSQKNFIKDAYIYGVPDISKTLGTTLTDIEKETLANLIVTKGDLKTEYNKYISRWMIEGGETWEKEATEIYKKENK